MKTNGLYRKVILYTSHCPKCDILAKKLNSKGILYKEVSDVDIMLKKGFNTMPMLETDGVIMDFSQANKWIDEYK